MISELLLLAVVSATPPSQIDELLSEAQSEHDVSPVAACSDDTFLRRISLDLIGRIPTRDELHAFRKHPDRDAKIDELLASDEFATFWAEVWTASLIGYRTQAFNVNREPLQAWMEQSLRDGVAYDAMVRKLIAAEGDSAFDGPVNFLLRHQREPAVKVSRMFLGVRLDCARCHDHPFDRWTRDDFDRFNAFFRSVSYRQISQRNVRVAETPRQAAAKDRPRFLTGATPKTSRWRDELALFVTTCKPFARNFANRIWYQLMGRGIVDPPDNFVDGAAVAPELLEHLAGFASESSFDIRAMIRAICVSQAYQRESGHADASPESHRLFASYVPKPLTPEQLLRSYETALQLEWTAAERNQQITRMLNASIDDDFSQTWQYRDSVQEVMQRLVEDHRMPDSSVTSIYEKILSRKPTRHEFELCRDRPRSQIVFALIHSNEFRFSH